MKYAAAFGAMVIFVAGCGLTPTDSVEGQNEPKVLIVTGIDYPGHKWRLTAPALAEVLGEDTRMKVDVVEQPEFLGTDEVYDYDVVVVHFMSWEKPTPGPGARANLKKFVNDGGGLVVLHFGCGAFRDWPEYRNLAGRVWDPDLRGHDPRGPFRVDIVNTEHPITWGMASFQTNDELYTCLTGNRPVKMLATARSKVDGKDYPMAFVFKYGKGSVFHCVLGHDVKAIKNPPVAELLRRGCAWTAGLTPVSANLD